MFFILRMTHTHIPKSKNKMTPGNSVLSIACKFQKKILTLIHFISILMIRSIVGMLDPNRIATEIEKGVFQPLPRIQVEIPNGDS